MVVHESAVVFVVSLLVGGLGLYAGGRVIAGVDDYRHAVWTALVGAVVWAVVGFFLGWIPLLGPAATLLAYVAVIKRRYPGGWVDAAGIALVAWIASLLVLSGLAAVGVGSYSAIGVPWA